MWQTDLLLPIIFFPYLDILDLLLLSVLSENDTDLISYSASCPLRWHWITSENLKISGELEDSTLKQHDCEHVKKMLAVD